MSIPPSRPPRRSLYALVSAGLVAVLTAAGLQGFSGPADAAPAPPPAGGGYWTATAEQPRAAKGGHAARVSPRSFEGYTLDREALADRLADAPLEGSGATPVTIRVPAPNGELVAFAVTESPIMQPRLAAAHPEITTYAGRGVADPTASIRLDLAPTGLPRVRARVRRAGGVVRRPGVQRRRQPLPVLPRQRGARTAARPRGARARRVHLPGRHGPTRARPPAPR